MAILAVLVRGSLGAVSPHVVVPGIVRGGWVYRVAVLVLALLQSHAQKSSDIERKNGGPIKDAHVVRPV